MTDNAGTLAGRNQATADAIPEL
ncbi:MAG: hypothetical protein QOJ90_2307, partial [Actinomycetota bacterium]|nr:hypothetical protein [Actinomycetota bacterium]